jgi:membrane-bound lytic murein transglycosylase B
MLQTSILMKRLAVLLGLFLAVQQTAAQAPSSPSNGVSEAAPAAPPQPFDEWLKDLQDEARTRGFDEKLVKEALDGLEPLPRVIQRDRSQAELRPGFNAYSRARLTRAMIRRGQDLSSEHRAILSRIEGDFDVQRRFVVAIWGIESRYGRLTGRTPVFQALATLAWEPRRADFFRGELFNALMMVDRRYIDARTMTGSWAGAMGQTQFMPSSYLQYAVDFDRDGRRDIWKSTPDALASIANYLKGYGWAGDYTWGREVRVPAAAQERIDAGLAKRPEGCYAIRNMTERVPLARWRAFGVTRADGGPLPQAAVDAGLVDVGERQFLVYPNYDAILGYNCAHYYALSVALLGDAIGAAGPTPQTPKPKARTSRRRSR